MVGKQYLIVISIAAVVSLVVFYEFRIIDTCKIQQLDIESKISQYAKTKDPLLCNSINEMITQFNIQCKSDLEIQDCG